MVWGGIIGSPPTRTPPFPPLTHYMPINVFCRWKVWAVVGGGINEGKGGGKVERDAVRGRNVGRDEDMGGNGGERRQREWKRGAKGRGGGLSGV